MLLSEYLGLCSHRFQQGIEGCGVFVMAFTPLDLFGINVVPLHVPVFPFLHVLRVLLAPGPERYGGPCVGGGSSDASAHSHERVQFPCCFAFCFLHRKLPTFQNQFDF